MRYSLFIGRWQPIHKGHIALIESVLKKGKNALIAVRDTKMDKDNPYSVKERKKAIKKVFKRFGKRVKVIKIDDIEEVCFGRKVGYEINEIKLSEELEKISATKIREYDKKTIK